MSILNIGLQSVDIMCKPTQKDALKSCNSTAAIQSLGENLPALKEKVIDALELMKVFYKVFLLERSQFQHFSSTHNRR